LEIDAGASIVVVFVAFYFRSAKGGCELTKSRFLQGGAFTIQEGRGGLSSPHDK